MIKKLVDGIVKKNAPIVVGLDPTLELIPEHIKKAAFEKKGETLKGAALAVWRFNRAIVDSVYDLVPAVKPQIAMYEQFGLPGLKAYKKTVDYCREKGLLVIGDVKRGDIGSTSKAYATAHLGKIRVGTSEIPVFDEDFATVNPYLGSDGVKPFIDVCRENDRGIFVLVKTSNPSSGEFQDRKTDEGTIFEEVAGKVVEWGSECMDGEFSNVGAVVGATYPEQGKLLREIMKKNFILVPGYGAQGGKGEDIKYFFDKEGLGAIVNSSRGIIGAWQKDPYKDRFKEEEFAEASRQAVLDMKADINGALGK